jgi:hypothetical protein
MKSWLQKIFPKLFEPPPVRPAATCMFDFASTATHPEAAHFLGIFWKGLDYLCQQVERVEQERAKSTGKNFAGVDFGSQPDDWLVCNYFVWYANALSNFIGVFAKAFSPSEEVETEFRKDLENKFNNEITWRKKVAAHTSWVWPKKGDKRDSVAAQSASVMLFPEFNFRFDGHFRVGGFILESETGGTSCSDWHWGLVSTHERLKKIVGEHAPVRKS